MGRAQHAAHHAAVHPRDGRGEVRGHRSRTRQRPALGDIAAHVDRRRCCARWPTRPPVSDATEAAQDQWNAVDSYISDLLVPADPVLDAALRDSAAADLPAIQVSPNQGKLLMLLAQTQGARSILEIGTLGGYSTIWLARALPPDGRLLTLEVEPKHAAVARANLDRAGLGDVVDVRLGRAADTLAQLVAEGSGPYDFVFIDADKPSTADYFTSAVALSRPGALIVIDNVVRRGEVLDVDSADAQVQGIRRMYDVMAAEPRVAATAIQTVGSKGYDGFAFAVVTAE
ncbi:MAG: O-methyltransferase [Acidothermales bacterium]|nr:O-methyltransferase [Acidothermales bacterium]